MQVSKTISRRFRTLPPPPFLIKDLVLNNVFCFFLAVFFFFRCICICCRSSGVKGGNAKLPTAAQNCNERGIYSSPAAEHYILFNILLFINWTLHSFLLPSNRTLHSFKTFTLINWTLILFFYSSPTKLYILFYSSSTELHILVWILKYLFLNRLHLNFKLP